MTANPFESADPGPSFELKGSSFTLPVLQLLDTDMDAVSRQLGEKVGQAPEFFQNAPVVIDLQRLRGPSRSMDFALLVGLLRGYGLIPVGVRGGNTDQNAIASTMELAVLSEGRAERSRPERPAQPPVQATRAGTLTVMRPVRSGQRIFAQDGDLIVLASVGSGAEILADGNIHVYGTLRGRALAGVKGNQEVRIFCQGLEAELISIAGNYRVSEDIADTVRSQPVQIFLDGQRLKIQPL